MRRLSASKVALAEQCVYWLRDDIAIDERSTWSSRLGSACHKAIELDLISASIHFDDLATEFSLTARQVEILESQLEAWRRWNGNVLSSQTAKAEVPYSWHPDTGQAEPLESDGHRDYSKAPPDAICGTADAVAIEGNTIYVYDWKFGGAWVEPPDTNWQMRTLGLFAAKAHSREYVIATIVKVGPDGVYPQSATYDAFDFFSIEHGLRRIARSRSPEAQPNPGTWCKYCPARKAGSCPAVQEDQLSA
jgi:uncharacterized protein DUF2800